MARAPVLSSSTLTPFGGGGGGFGAFSIVNPGREAYLNFLKVKVDWQQGKIPNADYLAAYQTYVNAQTAGSSTRIDAEQSLRDETYRLERNTLLEQVQAGTKTWTDLLTYDRGKLGGLDHGSQEYADRLNLYQQTQQNAYSDAAKAEQDLYTAGKLTASQYRSWFLSARTNPDYAGNVDLQKNVTEQVASLDLRITGEKDSQVVNDYGDGKMTTDSFVLYATAARARYTAGTPDALDWDKRIADAKDNAVEKSLTYRYGISQQYISLQKFITDNKAMLAKAGVGGTSTSSRIVLGADGQWKTVTSTKSTPYTPSASEVDAMKQRRIELADAERQLADVTTEITNNGGFQTTDAMIGYYTAQQGRYVKGTDAWYQVQGRLDSLNQQKHQETVMSAEGVHVTFGGKATPAAAPAAPRASGGAAAGGKSADKGGLEPAKPTPSPATTGGKDVTLDAFMAAIGHTESGGRYDAVNKSSGATGKYQIMPSNWSSWAAKYIGNANAPMSPENQEKVVRGKMTDLYKWLGDWGAVAHWWLTGSAGDKSTWSASSTNYVNKVMAGLGQPPVSKPASQGVKLSIGPNVASATGPLQVVTTVKTGGPSREGGAQPTMGTTRVRFPTNLDGAAFTKFYSGFASAFKQGETTFTDYSSGSAVTYAIPAELGARADMMNSLDDLRIGYYATRAQVYAGTPSEFAASSEYSNAIKDKADNAYTILITQQPGNAIQKLDGTKPVLDPIAQGLTVIDAAKAFAANQSKLAKEALDRGDITGAWAHTQLAQKTLSETAAKVKVYRTAAEATIGAIQAGSGEAAPDKVTSDLAKLSDWQTPLAPSLKGLDDTQAEIYKWAKLGADGHPSFNPDGTLVLHDGAAIFIDQSGKLSFQDVPSAGRKPDGTVIPSVPGFAPVQVDTGGTVPQATVYAKWEPGVVGYTTNGQQIMGKVVHTYVNGKQQIALEDPFHPGRWSIGAVPPTFAVPPGFRAVPGAQAGTMVYEVDVNRATGGGQTGTYRLSWNDTTGAYDIIKAGGLFGQDQVMPSGDADTVALFNSLGFKLDVSSVPNADRWMYNQMGAHLGFEKAGYYSFTDTSIPHPGKTQDDTVLPKLPPMTGLEANAGKAKDDLYRPPSLTPPAPVSTTAGVGTGKAADDWFKNQADKVAGTTSSLVGKAIDDVTLPNVVNPPATKLLPVSALPAAKKPDAGITPAPAVAAQLPVSALPPAQRPDATLAPPRPTAPAPKPLPVVPPPKKVVTTHKTGAGFQS